MRSDSVIKRCAVRKVNRRVSANAWKLKLASIELWEFGGRKFTESSKKLKKNISSDDDENRINQWNAMKLSTLFVIAFHWTVVLGEDPKVNQVNNVNPDGSFQFGWVETSNVWRSLNKIWISPVMKPSAWPLKNSKLHLRRARLSR